MKTLHFNIDPCPRPRLSQRDKWNPSKQAEKYFEFRDQMRIMAKKQGLLTLPSEIYAITFRIKMPDSWNQEKRVEFAGEPHTTRPDLDNILAGLFDVFGQDQHIHQIGQIKKVWGVNPGIEIQIFDEHIVKMEVPEYQGTDVYKDL